MSKQKPVRITVEVPPGLELSTKEVAELIKQLSISLIDTKPEEKTILVSEKEVSVSANEKQNVAVMVVERQKQP